jgi:hypothetical protein
MSVRHRSPCSERVRPARRIWTPVSYPGTSLLFVTDDQPPRRHRRRSAEAEPSVARRPRSMDPQELGFTPQRPVPWLAPLLLLSTGCGRCWRSCSGPISTSASCRTRWRRLFEQPGTDGELWFDYVADLGDGFHATYSVAYLLAQPQLEVDGARSCRAARCC